MDFLPKDFELLHMSHIRNQFDESNISSYYFFCLGHDILFIRRSKGYYKICASVSCGFKFLWHDTVFDVVYADKDLNKVISQFQFMCELLLKRM